MGKTCLIVSGVLFHPFRATIINSNIVSPEKMSWSGLRYQR